MLLAFFLSMLGFGFFSLKNRSLWSTRPRYAAGCTAVVLATALLLASCGGFSSENVPVPTANTTPPGTYTVFIVATPAGGSGFVVSQLSVPLTVTP
jgi:hypothetical protein